jgi:Astacin (Peptidase family M12A)
MAYMRSIQLMPLDCLSVGVAMWSAMAADGNPHCSTPPQPPLELPASMPLDRKRALMVGASKWVNGTVLRYAFFDSEPNPAWAPAGEEQRDVIRESFEAWKELPIGLEFKEVDSLGEAEVRIGFDQSDGSWSYVGRDILEAAASERTMNIGWDLTTPYGHTTALHEIGHTLGMPHEHQSPFSGIVWKEDVVYRTFSGPPNNWSRAMIESNILKKLQPAQVEGSSWDPASIMEYEFESGLISEPEAYEDGIHPPGSVSQLDVQWMQGWYPAGQTARALDPFVSAPLNLEPRGQVDFTISPPSSRTYELGTLSSGDTVAILFEKVDGELRYLAGDDDGGEDRNARIRAKLFQGREYVFRVRLVWKGPSDGGAAVYW